MEGVEGDLMWVDLAVAEAAGRACVFVWAGMVMPAVWDMVSDSACVRTWVGMVAACATRRSAERERSDLKRNMRWAGGRERRDLKEGKGEMRRVEKLDLEFSWR